MDSNPKHNIDQQMLETNNEIVKLLTLQNNQLTELHTLLARCMESEDKTNYFRTFVTDLNMSIGSMMGISLKWLVASIPAGIILWILVRFLYQVFG